MSEDVARHDISDHLDHIAEMMRIGRQAAKMYVTDDVIGDIADRIAAAVRAEEANFHLRRSPSGGWSTSTPNADVAAEVPRSSPGVYPCVAEYRANADRIP